MEQVSGFRFQVSVVAIAVILALLPFFVHAQAQGTGGFAPLVDLSQSGKLGTLYTSSSLSDFINGLFKFGIAIGAIGAVLRLAYAGYLYMGQSDMWSHKGQAKSIITDVTLGLLLLLGVYLILYQINPDIVNLKALNDIQSAPAQGPCPNGSTVNASGGC
jgi:heme/copper-type cytochrome/quinol oxidase subunit 4